MVGRLVEDQHVGAGVDEHGQRQPPPLAAGERRPAASRRPRRRTGSGRAAPAPCPGSGRWPAARPRARCARRPPAELLGVLGEVADLDVVADAAACPAASSRRPASVSISVVLPVPFGPTSDTCSPRSSHISTSSSSALVAGLTATRPRSSSTTRPLRSARLEGELAGRPRPGGRAVDPLDLVQLLGPRLRLPGARAGAEARDEALQALDLGLLALDRAAEGQLARRLLLAPAVPGPGEEPAAARPRAPAPRCRPPPGTSGRGRRARPPRRARSGVLEPLQRLDVEMVGRLVEQQQVGLGRPAPGRARRASARRRRRCRAGGRGRRRSRKPRPCRVAERAVAPVVAAGVLQPRLCLGVAGERRLVVVAGGHPPARARPARASIATSSGAAGEHVVAQRASRARGAGAGRAARPWRPWRTTSSPPSTEASPESIRSSVVLPAPLRPDSVIRSRRSSLNETPRSSGSPAMSLAGRMRSDGHGG